MPDQRSSRMKRNRINWLALAVTVITTVLCAGSAGHAQAAPGVPGQRLTQQQAVALKAMAAPRVSSPGISSGVVLNTPVGLAFDAAGSLYIADANNQVVRKVDTAGNVTAVAGSGTQGFAGDGGPATSAALDTPLGVVVDGSGNLYIADAHNQRIRVVSATTGNITTLAGNGTAGFSGDGGAASSASLALPTAVALDSAGNLYIADTNNHRIRKVAIATGIITTVAGNGQQFFSGDGGAAIAAGLDSPNGVAVDSAGRIYIADTHNQRIRLVATDGTISTFSGTGAAGFGGDGASAAAASLAHPTALALDAQGNVYIADSNNQRIREVTGGTINTVAGSGTQGFGGAGGAATQAMLDTPRGIAVNSSTGFTLADTNNDRVRVVRSSIIDPSGGVPTVTVQLSAPSTEVYGSGTLTASFTASGSTPTGTVTFSAGGAVLGTSTVTSGTATFSIGSLPVGTDNFVATYSGDSTYPAVTSAPVTLTITPLALVATVNSVIFNYGQPVPTITGTLTGVLPQDNGKVSPVFATTATATSPAGTYPVTVSLSGPAAGNYSVQLAVQGASGSTVTVVPAPLTITAANATRIYGTANPPFTGTVNGQRNGDTFTESFTTAAALASNAGVYSIIPSVTGASLGSYTVTPVDGTLTVSQAASIMTFSSAEGSPGLGHGVILTASVASTTSGTPTGSVQFLDGGTVLGAGVLSPAGIATFTASFSTVGAQTITAVYQGDINFTGSSATLSETVTAPTFTLSINKPALTITAGESALPRLNITPVGNYQGNIVLTCANLPIYSACIFTPASVAADGSGTLLPASVIISTFGPATGTVSSNTAHPNPTWVGRGATAPVQAAVFLLPAGLLAGFLGVQRRRLRVSLRQLLTVVLAVGSLLGMMTGLTGCGIFNCCGTPDSPAGTYSITLTATGTPTPNTASGPVTRAATFTLAITP